MSRGRQRIRDRAGSDVLVDHHARTITGRIALPRPGACPHRLVAGEDRAEHPCIGEAGHGRTHVTRDGRTWR